MISPVRGGTRLLLVVLTAAAASAGLASCEAGTRSSTTRRVDIAGLQFDPPSVTLSPGDTLIWVNHDVVPHIVVATDGSWSSPPLASGGEWRLVVEGDVDVEYLCTYHPMMRGGWVVW